MGVEIILNVNLLKKSKIIKNDEFRDFRKLLGDRTKQFSDEKLEEIRHDIYKFANLAFDIHHQNPGLYNDRF